jgi:hypothetical protein
MEKPAVSGRGLPSFTPRARAAASAALEVVSSAFTSAKAPKMRGFAEMVRGNTGGMDLLSRLPARLPKRGGSPPRQSG